MPSDSKQPQTTLWETLIGLGENSHKKSFPSELQERIEALERFRDVLEKSPDAIFLLESPSTKILDANLAACRMLSLSRKALLETSLLAVTGLGDLPRAMDLIKITGQRACAAESVETVLFPKGGDAIPVEISLNSYSVHENHYVAAVVRDIAERKEAQSLFSERSRLAELGSRIGRALTEVQDMVESLQDCAEALEACTGAAFVGIWTIYSDSEKLLLQASAGMYTHTDGNHSCNNIDEYPYQLGVICRERRPSVTNNVIDDPHFLDQEWARREGIVAFAGYPLIFNEQLIGVVALFSKRALSDVALSTLVSVANMISIAIERFDMLSALPQAVERADQARDKIDAILRSIADGLVVTDMDGRIVLMNRYAERLLGVAQGLTIGQSIVQVVKSRTLLEHLKSQIDRGGYSASFDLEMPDHELSEMRLIHVRTSQVRSKSGEVSALLTIFRDISREKEVDRMKSEFITVAAHELRTPLTSVKGFSELIMNSSDLSGNELKDYAAHICDSAGMLEQIVDDLLDLSRIDSGGTLTLNKAPCDLGAILEEVIVARRIAFPQYEFTFCLPDKTGALMLDCEMIRRVVANLLDNATKFSPEGTTICLECRISARECRIVLRDEGPGMSPEQMRQCFKRFYRGETGDTARGGLGLGLAISRTIVESHGGEMQIESEEGEGTTVSFTLPVERAM